ncbi:LysR family transcriptional regulator [Alginatibacterium sediminis]|uniref:LysR family transcriptional regulator n=1 Tax=Alginatibacterium sediminis TaxID=2164068 RepID=A0A420EHY6_9ALTE|nr:LysR substrate-binding domain-containing protein [Alginatibacterium sediminis]RKF20305.1 LysR family transcriptional regulator [Alginatibacterium sediminis]
MPIDSKILHDFNLNLLIVFETVMRKSSYSKAAETLDVSVASVSKNMDRLRSAFDDPLFIRVGRGIEPTVYALELSDVVRPMLERLSGELMAKTDFDCRQSEQQFVICAPKMVESVLAPQLIVQSQREAPKVSFEWQESKLMNQELSQHLRQHKANVMFDIEASSDPSIRSELVCLSEYKLVCAQSHPRMKRPVSLEQFNAERHVAFNNKGFEPYARMLFRGFGIERNISYRTGSLFSLVQTLSHSELVGLLPEWSIRNYKTTSPLKVLDLDFNLPQVHLYMQWHAQGERNGSQMWLLEQLRNASRQAFNISEA